MKRSLIVLAMTLATMGGAIAQQEEIKWSQTLNIPKGQTIFRDRADILGIEFGDTYAEAKAKLQKLSAEGVQKKGPSADLGERMIEQMDGQDRRPPLREERTLFRVNVPGASTVITASYVGKLILNRQLPGARPITETIQVYLSSPASGQQVTGMERLISYPTDADQPRVSEFIGQMEAKLKAKPQVFPRSDGAEYRFQFNDGQPFVPAVRSTNSCSAHLVVGEAHSVRNVNSTGDCDVVMQVQVNFGISRDHARSIAFYFGDNERAKANAAADFAFISDYIRGLQGRTRGTPPKL